MMTNVLNSMCSILAQVPAEAPVDAATQAIRAAAESGTNIWQFLGQLGGALALGLAAIGSALGIGVAGKAAAGAWAKEAKAGQGLRFTYIILLGMPISQTLYAMIVMGAMGSLMMTKQMAIQPNITAAYAGLLLAVGIATGTSSGFAWPLCTSSSSSTSLSTRSP